MTGTGNACIQLVRVTLRVYVSIPRNHLPELLRSNLPDPQEETYSASEIESKNEALQSNRHRCSLMGPDHGLYANPPSRLEPSRHSRTLGSGFDNRFEVHPNCDIREAIFLLCDSGESPRRRHREYGVSPDTKGAPLSVFHPGLILDVGPENENCLSQGIYRRHQREAIFEIRTSLWQRATREKPASKLGSL